MRKKEEYEDEDLEEALVAGEDVLVKEAEEALGDGEGLYNLTSVKKSGERGISC